MGCWIVLAVWCRWRGTEWGCFSLVSVCFLSNKLPWVSFFIIWILRSCCLKNRALVLMLWVETGVAVAAAAPIICENFANPIICENFANPIICEFFLNPIICEFFKVANICEMFTNCKVWEACIGGGVSPHKVHLFDLRTDNWTLQINDWWRTVFQLERLWLDLKGVMHLFVDVIGRGHKENFQQMQAGVNSTIESAQLGVPKGTIILAWACPLMDLLHTQSECVWPAD